MGVAVCWIVTSLGTLADPPQKHIEITGRERLRITYDSSFTWPEGGGYRAVMDLPVPPDTGAQHIEDFSSSLHGQVETDERNDKVERTMPSASWRIVSSVQTDDRKRVEKAVASSMRNRSISTPWAWETISRPRRAEAKRAANSAVFAPMPALVRMFEVWLAKTDASS